MSRNKWIDAILRRLLVVRPRRGNGHLKLSDQIRSPDIVLPHGSGLFHSTIMNTQPTIISGPTGFRIEAEGHLSDAILQAWTWRFFRKHARELGGAAWRREPTFTTEAGALEWVETVRDWYAIVHPGSGFEISTSPYPAEAMAFASRTQAMLARHGIAMTLSASGKDIGWTPITFEKRSRWHEEDAWAWQDGSYGLIDELHGMHPRAEGESEDDHSERIHGIADTYEAAFIAGLEAGQRSGEFQGVAWEFLPLTEYPKDRI